MVTDGIESSRPQDVGRRHRRKAAPSPATATLLELYQEAMRRELAGLLVELTGIEQSGQLGLDGKPLQLKRPELSERVKLWDLAIKLGRELAGEIDPGTPGAPAPAPARPPRRGRVDYG